MSVSLTTIKKLVIRELNIADPGYPSLPADDSYDDGQITDAILAIDGAICVAICANPEHPFRPTFFQTATLAHGAQVPAGDGPVESVIIASKSATLWDKQEIEVERTNTLGLTYEAHYVIEGRTLYHNGSGNAAVVYPKYTLGAV